jgi:hypothetical protein
LDERCDWQKEKRESAVEIDLILPQNQVVTN